MTTTEAPPVQTAEPIAAEPVDQIPTPKPTAFTRITAHREGTKQPILVDWLRKADERNPIARWALGYAWHVFLFHFVRLPLYQAKLTALAPVGLFRTVRAIVNAVTDAEARPLRNGAVIREDSKEYLQLVRERNSRVKRRAIVLSVLAVPVLAGVGAAALFLNGPLFYAVVAVVLDLLGFIGRPKTQPLISKATMPLHLPPVLREGHVEAALRSLNNSAINKAERIEFEAPIFRDGPGWTARINLPLGVTPENIMSKRAELASGLRRPLGCVWPESGAETHGGLLKLFVAFEDLATMKQPPYPLAKGQADLFKRLPFGTSNRGAKIGIELFENNLLIGAIPGAGKTNVVRTLAVGASLDPTAEIHVWELFGKGDLSCMEKVAHRYGSGLDDETMRACMADLREIRADIEKRAASLKRLTKEARELVPDAKTTRDVANKRRLGLFPKVIFLDEVQNLYTHEEFGKEAERLVLDIIKMGRAIGVILVQSTQRPDAGSLPKAISAQAGIRIGLRMMGWLESDMILGTGMNSKGITSAQFTKKDRGCAWLIGVEDEPMVGKSYYLSTPEAERLTSRARELRQAASLLTGYASGELDLDPDDSLLYNVVGDVRRVLAEAGASWMWSTDIVARLAELRQAHYGGWSEEMLAKALTPSGVTTKQLNRTGSDGVRRNLMGIEMEQLDEAEAARNTPPTVPAA